MLLGVVQKKIVGIQALVSLSPGLLAAADPLALVVWQQHELTVQL